MTQEHPDDLSLPGAAPLTSAVLHILLALADGEKHGYAIMQEVRTSTGGAVRMGPGTLYGSIQRMLKDGLIVEVESPPRADALDSEERRRFYRLTASGRQVLQAEVRRLERVVQEARSKRVLPGFDLRGGA